MTKQKKFDDLSHLNAESEMGDGAVQQSDRRSRRASRVPAVREPAFVQGWEVLPGEEPRVRDIEIAERAGMAQPRDVRRVIEKNREEIEAHGLLTMRVRRARIEKTGAINGGREEREVSEYWLNEAQAIALVTHLRTPKALEVRIALVKFFVAYRNGAVRGDTTRALDRVLRLEAAQNPERLWEEECIASLCRTYRIQRTKKGWPSALSGVAEWFYRLVLGADVYAEMKARNPGRGSDRDADHYAFFQDCLRRVVVDDLRLAVVLSDQSANKDEFKQRMEAHYRKKPFQLLLGGGAARLPKGGGPDAA
jgi:phage regulator Rha-like protein